MTTGSRKPGSRLKRDRFGIHEDEVVITGRHLPSPEERDDADRVFDRILRNRKPKKD